MAGVVEGVVVDRGLGEFVHQVAAGGLGQERQLERLSDSRKPSISGHRIRPFLPTGRGDASVLATVP
ncbi:hypothetical protein, partial [Streptomyces glomeratus]